MGLHSPTSFLDPFMKTFQLIETSKLKHLGEHVIWTTESYTWTEDIGKEILAYVRKEFQPEEIYGKRKAYDSKISQVP